MLSDTNMEMQTVAHVTYKRSGSFIPWCAVWPAASHLDLFVCTPWFYNETKPVTEKEKGNQELILTQRAFVLNSLSFWPRSTK